jgi:hypothetical protein
MAASLFEKLNAGFADLPIVAGANVFVTSDYQKAIGLQERQTERRLKWLLEEGKVQRVRTRRNGRVVPAWRYLGK